MPTCSPTESASIPSRRNRVRDETRGPMRSATAVPARTAGPGSGGTSPSCRRLRRPRARSADTSAPLDRPRPLACRTIQDRHAEVREVGAVDGCEARISRPHALRWPVRVSCHPVHRGQVREVRGRIDDLGRHVRAASTCVKACFARTSADVPLAAFCTPRYWNVRTSLDSASSRNRRFRAKSTSHGSALCRSPPGRTRHGRLR